MAVNKSESKFVAKRRRLKAMGPYKPQFSLGLDSATSSGKDYYRSLPFKRSWIAILISGAFLAMFSTPLFTVGGSLLDAGDGGLFSLVSLLFTGFWLLGWSTGVAVLLILFLILVFGRETLRVNQGDLILRVGLFGIGFGARYRKELVRDFRSQQPDESAGTGWRGPHLVFNYGREEIGFGSAIDEERAQFLITELRELFPSESSPPAKLDFSAMQEKIRMPGPPMVGIETGNAIGITSLSSLALLVANLIPILGVLLYDWDIGEVMLLFWAESAVIGFYNLLKLGKVSGWAVLFYGPFFVGHYGGFMAGHLLFIYAFFGSSIAGEGDISTAEVFADFLRLAPALLAFFISHGISYYVNFLGRREYIGKDTGKQMGEPYRRIIIMHVTIIFGGFLTMMFGSAVPALTLLILLKTIADLRGHLSQHAG